MSQIFFIGASAVYGVGGDKGGVADLTKIEIHQKMYGSGGIGEENGHEIYNLAVPGATSANIIERLDRGVKSRNKGRNVITLFSGGSNDTKNLSDPSDTSKDSQYRQNAMTIIQKLKEISDQVIIFGLTPVDETKTNPRVHADGTKVYFFNENRKRLESILMEVAKENSLQAIPLFDDAMQNHWINNCLYADGLHPNTAGHQWIYDRIKPTLWKAIGL